MNDEVLELEVKQQKLFYDEILTVYIFICLYKTIIHLAYVNQSIEIAKRARVNSDIYIYHGFRLGTRAGFNTCKLVYKQF